jgi:hypothetical protein
MAMSTPRGMTAVFSSRTLEEDGRGIWFDPRAGARSDPPNVSRTSEPDDTPPGGATCLTVDKMQGLARPR